MPNSSAPIIVLGAGGQVGRALVAILGERCIGLDRSLADLSKPSSLPRALGAFDASAVINAAAYTAVDLAETERALAMTVNGESPGVIATWCAERAIPLIHYSTDYVFPGTGTQAWSEVDDVAPLNQYGASKLAGERAIADVGAQAIVMRTSWVYDAIGKNFVTTMLRLGRDRTTLSIVADQHGAPTYAPHLARATVDALHLAEQTSSFIPGIYHVCNAGETTWYDFASDIFANARERGIALTVDRLDPIATKDYPTPAARPLNSRLNTQKASDVLNITLPNWRDGLIECMDNYEGH